MASREAESDAGVVLSVGNGGWVRVEQADCPPTLLRVAPDDSGRYRIVELHLTGSPLRPTDLRQIRLGWIEQVLNLPDAREDLAISIRIDGIDMERLAKHYSTSWGSPRLSDLLNASGLPVTVIKDVDPELRKQKAFSEETQRQGRVSLAKGVLNDRYAKRRPLAKPITKRFPGSFYLQVAAAYRAALREGAQPTPFIAQEATVPVTTAARWVKEARRRGYLGAGHQGRSGEAPELTVRYVGPSQEVIVPLPDGREPTVKRGDVLTAPTDYALAMLEQETNWQPVPEGEK